MSTSAVSTDATSWHGPLEVQVTFETTLGLLAAFFISFFTPVVFGLIALVGLVQGRIPIILTGVPMTLVTGWLALLIARMAAEASVGRLADRGEPPPAFDPTLPVVRLPFALAMAARLPMMSWFWRPWLAVWWMGHFCIAAAFGHFVAVSLIKRLDVATAIIAVPLAVLVHFAFLFASNLYLVIAARALVSSPRLCVRVWKYRFMIDFAIASLMLLRGLK
ncbi:MAG TPA: hypothetical protein VM165_03225 [Planctomycetaceae bacterium]|nr:hypothetical protein [Planctomycetaceae bacterium]